MIKIILLILLVFTDSQNCIDPMLSDIQDNTIDGFVDDGLSLIREALDLPITIVDNKEDYKDELASLNEDIKETEVDFKEWIKSEIQELDQDIIDSKDEQDNFETKDQFKIYQQILKQKLKSYQDIMKIAENLLKETNKYKLEQYKETNIQSK